MQLSGNKYKLTKKNSFLLYIFCSYQSLSQAAHKPKKEKIMHQSKSNMQHEEEKNYATRQHAHTKILNFRNRISKETCEKMDNN